MVQTVLGAEEAARVALFSDRRRIGDKAERFLMAGSWGGFLVVTNEPTVGWGPRLVSGQKKGARDAPPR